MSQLAKKFQVLVFLTTILFYPLPFSFPATAQVVTEIIDATGDGSGNTLDQPWDITVDGSGNVYLAGRSSDNAFKITSGGVVTEIIDATGDGTNTLDFSQGIAVDGSGNVFITGGNDSNAFKITPGGSITEIIDASGDGGGNTLSNPFGIAVDGSGNVYVTGWNSNNVFKITPGGVITEIIDATGDGSGNTLLQPWDITVDGSGNVYVTGVSSHNAFKITPGGAINEIIDATGDGSGNILDTPFGIAVDGSGNVYVSGIISDNAFKITPGGAITGIIDTTGDGSGNMLDSAVGIAVDGSGNVYVAAFRSDNVFKVEPTLPVELVSFDAIVDESQVLLTWQTASETNNSGFEVQQKLADTFETLDFVEGQGTTAESHIYSYRVKNPAPGHHVFRLKQLDFDGTFAYSAKVEVTIELTETYELSSAYPNPFNPQATFTLAVREQQHVRVELYSVLGQRVAVLYDGELAANTTRTFTIDGQGLSSGLYVYRVTGERFTESHAVLLAK